MSLIELANVANREKLREFETKYKHRIVNQPVSKNDKPKKFATFPYPYMNGRLHLGHAFTITRAEFWARYWQSRGYNVLFPFGFHGSGMPIYACANKLKYELDNGISTGQVKILLDMGVTSYELPNFINPEYWISYFSEKAKEDIQALGIMSDLRRSFYTTTLNPYYDSFVKWQFHHLIRQGRIIKGTRFMVYSPKDRQPCADHDRSEGEGVEPVKYFVKIDGDMLVTCCNESTGKYYNPKLKYVSVTYGNEISDEIFVCSEKASNNIKYQYANIDIRVLSETETKAIFDGYMTTNMSFGTGIYNNDKNPKRDEDNTAPFSYYEPEKEVISRSGDVCVVAPSEQWFINYNDAIVKEKITNFVQNVLATYDEGVKTQFINAVEWLGEWPVTRNYGLGTYLEGTEQLIDSLSDSTIYMAYYTIAHIITKIPINDVTYDVWDYVFLNSETISNSTYMDKLTEMRNEFKYWYPVDLRVSGKDLIQNHLTMALFNHEFIWGGNYPQSFMINGYLMINNKKMSKHTGNFLTLRDAVDKFGADATRIALADSDGIDDGNFVESQASSAILKLTTELSWIESVMPQLKVYDGKQYAQFVGLFEQIFVNEINICIRDSQKGYESGKTRLVVLSFYRMINAKNEYLQMIKKTKGVANWFILMKYINSLITVIQPICPFWSEKIHNVYDENDLSLNVSWEYGNIDNKCVYIRDIIIKVAKDVNSEINRLRKRKHNITSIHIKIVSDYGPTEKEIIQHVKDDTLSRYKDADQTSTRKFSKYINDKIRDYGKEYYEWIENSDDEFTSFANNIKYFIDGKIDITVEKIDPNDDCKFKFGPGSPIVQIKSRT